MIDARKMLLAAAGVSSVSIGPSMPAAASHSPRHSEPVDQTIARLEEARRTSSLADTLTGDEAGRRDRIAQWYNFPNFPNWGNWRNW
jgi:hypothetical protein